MVRAQPGDGKALEVWTHEGLRFLSDHYRVEDHYVVLDAAVQAVGGAAYTGLGEGNRVVLPRESVKRMVETDGPPRPS